MKSFKELEFDSSEIDALLEAIRACISLDFNFQVITVQKNVDLFYRLLIYTESGE